MCRLMVVGGFEMFENIHSIHSHVVLLPNEKLYPINFSMGHNTLIQRHQYTEVSRNFSISCCTVFRYLFVMSLNLKTLEKQNCDINLVSSSNLMCVLFCIFPLLFMHRILNLHSNFFCVNLVLHSVMNGI